MKNNTPKKQIIEFERKTKDIKEKLEFLEWKRQKLEQSFSLKPDKDTTKEVNTSSSQELEDSIKQTKEELKNHLEQQENLDFVHQNEQKEQHEQEIEPSSRPENYEWLHDPDEMQDSNVLAHQENGVSVAQIEYHDQSCALDSREPNAQLLLLNSESERWQDGGIHQYDDAITRAEDYAAQYEENHQQEFTIEQVSHEQGEDI